MAIYLFVDVRLIRFNICLVSHYPFLYNSRTPVAKRNFRIRHAHFPQPSGVSAGNAGVKPKKEESKKRKATSQDASSTTDDSDLTTQSPDADEVEPARVKDDGNNTSSNHSRTEKKRTKVWSKMLDHFPTNGDWESKKEWLAQVLLVSDKKTPRKELRTDIKPRDDTRELAAVYLEKSTKPRSKHGKAEKTAEV